jgi:membrane protease YdiL (CAAX protease family)
MSLKFRCSKCDQEIIVKYVSIGESAKCMNCGAYNVVPANAETIDRELVYQMPKDIQKPMAVDILTEKAPEPLILPPDFPTMRDLGIGVGLIWLNCIVLIFAIGFILKKMKITGYKYELFNLSASLVDGLFVLLISWFFLCKKYGKSIKEGFSLKRIDIKTALWSILIGIAASLLSFLTDIYFPLGDCPMDKYMPTFKSSTFSIVLFTLMMTIYAPIFEEIYYRGFLFTIFRKHKGTIYSIIMVSLWFGIVHGSQYGWNIMAILSIIILASSLTIIRHIKDSLYPAILIHFVFNTFAALMMFTMLTPQTAIPICNFELSLNTKNADLHRIRGYWYIEQGYYDKALSDFKNALHNDPKNYHCYNDLAWFYVTCPDKFYRNADEALKLAMKAVGMKKTHETLDTLACAYAEKGDFTQAIYYAEKAYKKEKSDEYLKQIEAFKQKKTYLQYKAEKDQGNQHR